MLPILATVGHGLAWFALTMGQLALWGFGITIGFWVGKKFTEKLDRFREYKLASFLWTKHAQAVTATA